MLIVLLIISTVSGYAVVTYMRTQSNLARNDAAVRFSVALEKAQHDSGKRRYASIDQMSFVKVIDSKSYSLNIDADQNGQLDPPAITKLPTVHSLRIRGPFPKYVRFDWLGRVVDDRGELIRAPLVTFVSSAGTSMIKLEPGAKPQVIYGK